MHIVLLEKKAKMSQTSSEASMLFYDLFAKKKEGESK